MLSTMHLHKFVLSYQNTYTLKLNSLFVYSTNFKFQYSNNLDVDSLYLNTGARLSTTMTK